MGSVRDYLEVHKVLRATLLLLAFVVASFAFSCSLRWRPVLASCGYCVDQDGQATGQPSR